MVEEDGAVDVDVDEGGTDGREGRVCGGLEVPDIAGLECGANRMGWRGFCWVVVGEVGRCSGGLVVGGVGS